MKKSNFKKIIAVIIIVLTAIIGGTIYFDGNDLDVSVGNIIVENVLDVLTQEELQEIKEEIETKEIPALTQEDEEQLEIQETEAEGFELQGNIAYESGQDNIPTIQVGEKIGLTYYSQIDSRWKNIMYSSKGDSNQTIGSSGCGPTSAAMVVTSIKGIINPQEMSSLYTRYGFRSANDGTYWSAFRWTADVWDIPYQETIYLNTAVDLIKNNNYAIVACGNGLFTTGGHLIMIVRSRRGYAKNI